MKKLISIGMLSFLVACDSLSNSPSSCTDESKIQHSLKMFTESMDRVSEELDIEFNENILDVSMRQIYTEYYKPVSGTRKCRSKVILTHGDETADFDFFYSIQVYEDVDGEYINYGVGGTNREITRKFRQVAEGV